MEQNDFLKDNLQSADTAKEENLFSFSEKKEEPINDVPVKPNIDIAELMIKGYEEGKKRRRKKITLGVIVYAVLLIIVFSSVGIVSAYFPIPEEYVIEHFRKADYTLTEHITTEQVLLQREDLYDQGLRDIYFFEDIYRVNMIEVYYFENYRQAFAAYNDYSVEDDEYIEEYNKDNFGKVVKDNMFAIGTLEALKVLDIDFDEYVDMISETEEDE